MRLSLFIALAAISTSLGSAQTDGWSSQSVIRIVKPASSGPSFNTIDIRLRDDCDPATFNAAIPSVPPLPPTCIGGGNTTFDRFLAEFTAENSVGAWRYSTDQTDAKLGQLVTLENRGGETHTFTKVEKFGGGFVDLLNGNKAPAPECATVTSSGLKPIGPNASSYFVGPQTGVTPGPKLSDAGEQKYQCCVHPWMRITINVQGAGKEGRKTK